MAFQTPITIKAALDAIQRHDFVLPAIQREFVWGPQQVCRLFDSLMQGYPIGSFLFWRIEHDNSRDYTWYGFIREYHQKSARHCPVLDLPPKPLVAILDGQQRLTALNIGLRGSHAEKEPRKWWNNPDAFPMKRLYLNLCRAADDNEQRLQHDFRFLTPERAKAQRDDGHHWYLVADIAKSADTYHVIETLQELGLGNNRDASKVLARLHHLVHAEPVIPYFEERQQDLDKVLNIFIRVNSGGTVLSYSDLLLSIATASWKGLDARAAIHGLVDELNAVRNGFQFSKDLVLKAGLMLADIPSVAFRVTNFNARNMETLNEHWTAMSKTLRLAVELLADFGFSAQTLAADSVLIPIAYYLHRRGLGDNYRDAVAYAADRNLLRGWVLRTLVKSGIWGSGLDTLLLAIRSTLQEHGADGFPVAEVEAAMAKRGKYLRHFTDDEVQDLLDSPYGEKRTLALLALLFPHCDLRHLHHVDHVFPRSLFTAGRLRKAGVAENLLDEFHDKANRLANLQLLEGTVNKSKLAKLPAEWLTERFPDEAERTNYRSLHDLGEVPPAVTEFGDFYAARRERLAVKLRKLLDVTSEPVDNSED